MRDARPSLPTATVRQSLRARWRRLVAYQRAAVPSRHTPVEAVGGFLLGWRDRGALLRLLAFAALAVLFVLQASVYWVAVIDDSYITFRFVDNFVAGHGWRFNVDGEPVEGFTNFLWAVLLLVPHALGCDLMYVSKLMGLASGVAAMAGTWALTAQLRGRDGWLNLIPPALLAVNAHFAHWSMMGLETLLQVALVVWAYARFVAERRELARWPVSALLCVLAAMTRIDSLFYLSPLGLYGIWMVLLRWIPLRRMVTWALVAAIPFSVYTGWRYAYFGSLAPNTYWAKQRHIVFEGRDRGLYQLQRYYFGQSGPERPQPTDAVTRAAWTLTGSHWNGWSWMNLWILGFSLTGLAGCTRLMIPWWVRRRRPALCDAFAAGSFALVLLPWALSIYYIHHVNGDWMPGYRFFQMGLPFIAVAVGFGFGWLATLAGEFITSRWRLKAAMAGIGLLPTLLLSGAALEQLSIHTVYVFGKNSYIYIPRQSGWSSTDSLKTNWLKGFAPPLRDVSEELLLNTHDGAHILMSDIGQPMWFATHLSLHDVDGLVDARLAHHPRLRGDLPTADSLVPTILAEWGKQTPTKSELRQAHIEARKRDFHQHVARNARWLMEEAKPEYLLLFVNHEQNNPRSPGHTYPEISGQVRRTAGFEEYEDVWNAPKVGNVYNHLYKRRGIPLEVSDTKKVERLLRTVERNPRMPAVVVTLVRVAGGIPGLDPALQRQVRELARESVRRFPADPAVVELANLMALGGEYELAVGTLSDAIAIVPGNVPAVRALALLYERAGDYRAAARVLRGGMSHAPRDDNQLHYQLVWCHEVLGEYEEAHTVAREGTRRRPQDPRAWVDLASTLVRSGRNQMRTPEERLRWLTEARTAFQRHGELIDSIPPHIVSELESIGRDIETLSTPPKRVTGE